MTNYYPLNCSICLAAPVAQVTVNNHYVTGLGKSVTYKTKIPVCATCHDSWKKKEKRFLLAYMLLVVIGVAAGIISTGGANVIAGVFWGAVAGYAIVALTAKYFRNNKFPVKYDKNGVLVFENKEFAELFDKYNNSDEIKERKMGDLMKELQKGA